MNLHGLYVPLITPFNDSGAVAFDSLEALAHRALDEGATGLVAFGTTGEPGSLTAPERKAILGLLTGIGRDRRAPVVVGANSVPALHEAAQDGVVAALTLVPPLVRPGEDGVYAYFEHLTSASALPMLVYHIPYRTGQELSVEAIRRLATLPGIVGIKYAAGALSPDSVALLTDPPDAFTLLCGDDVLLSPMLALGAHGAIAASAHVATAEFTELLSAWASPVAAARPLGRRLAALASALFAEPSPTVIKGVLHALGQIPTPSVRLPLVAARQTTVDAALAALRRTVGPAGWTISSW